MEFVYVGPRRDLFVRAFPHGLLVLDAAGMADVVARIAAGGYFVERRHAEQDASLKQIIPYCVVTRRGEVFLTRRTAKGGDSRLHGKRSIGIGGHINPVDGANVLELGMQREIDEELRIDGPWSAHAVGLLNDDSTDVGSVHLGVVNLVRAEGDVAVRETQNLAGGFLEVAELTALCRAERGTFETWSAILIDRLGEILRV